MSKDTSLDSIKTVANCERIALGIDSDEISSIAEAYGLDELEALVLIFRTGYEELDARATMLEEEAGVWAREDGAHVVDETPGEQEIDDSAAETHPDIRSGNHSSTGVGR